ncbi:radical SAM protein [Chloroflexota bacterium]
MVIIRPPSEANSLLLPVTLGCSHNRCTFCGAYKGIKFRIRVVDEIKADIDGEARSLSHGVGRVFLENGDALVCRQGMLVEIMEYLNKRFPNMERVGTYASPQNLLSKSIEDLMVLKELKLGIIYFGVETGDEEMLKRIEKGVTVNQMVEAARKTKAAGITLSVTVILGLAGAQGGVQHALQTANALTEINPDFCGALTLMLEPGASLYEQWQRGEFAPASPFQSLEELRQIIAHSDFTDCFFTSNHASNYLPLRLRLPQQKEEGLKLLDKILATKDERTLRPEYFRAL